MSTRDVTRSDASTQERTLGQVKAAEAGPPKHQCPECRAQITVTDENEFGHARGCARRPETTREAETRTLAEFCK